MAWQVKGQVCGGVVVVRLGSVDGGAAHPWGGLIDRMFQCCTSCLVRAASVETPKYLHLVSPLPALVSRILLTRRRNLVSKSALVAEWPKVIQENFAIILLETALQKYLLTREMLKMC